MEKTIAGYLIEQKLPQIGAAEVYQAIDLKDSRPVILKLLPAGVYPALREFKQQIADLEKLNNPVFLPILNVDEWEGRILLVMEYMPGGSLAERIQDGPLSDQEASHVIYRLARGLELAHRLGIYHENIHPRNILLDEQGHAHLSDFGVAQLFRGNPEGSLHFLTGNPLYMSPDQLLGHPAAGAARDMYALGILYDQLLRGDSTPQETTPVAAAIQLIEKPFAKNRKKIKNIPRKINTIIAKALTSQTSKRQITAGKLAKSLEKWVENTAVAQLQEELRPAVQFIQNKTHLAKEAKSAAASQRRRAFFSTSGAVLFTLLMACAGIILGLRQIGIPLASLAQLAGNSASATPSPQAAPTSVPSHTATSMPAASMRTASPTPQPSSTSTSAPQLIVIPTLPPTPESLVIGGADKIAFIYNDDIWMTNLDGSNAEQLTTDGEPKSDLVWTPDGNYLLFRRDRATYQIDYLTRSEQVAGGWDFYEHKFCELRRGSMTRYSNDGKTAATVVKTYDENNRTIDVIQVFDLSEGCANARIDDQFPPGRFEMRGYSKATDSSIIPEYAWDGDQLFVIRGNFLRSRGDMTIYNLKTKTGEVVNPIGGQCCYRDFDWSPDGQYLLFTFQDVNTALTTEIYYIQYGTIESGVSHTPIALPAFFNFNPNVPLYPALRPHPQPVAQITTPEPINEDVGDVAIAGVDKIAIVKKNDIWIFNPDGSGVRQITADGNAKSDLQWTPDGNTILYEQFNCLYRVDIESRESLRMGCYQTAQLSQSGRSMIVSDYVEFPDALARLRAVVAPFNLAALSRFKSLSQINSIGGCPFLEGDLYRWSEETNIAAVMRESSQGNRLVDTVNVYQIGDCDDKPILLTRFPESRFELEGFSEPASKAIIEDFAWNGQNLFAINGDIHDNFGKLTLFDMNTGRAEILDPLQISCCYRDMRWNSDGSYLFFSALINDIRLYFLPFDELKNDQEFSSIPLPAGFFAGSDTNVRLYPALRPANRPVVFHDSQGEAPLTGSSVNITTSQDINTRESVAYAVDFSPDDSQIVTGSDALVKLWQVNTGKNTRTFGVGSQEHSEPVTSVKFSQDGEWVASASVDHSVRVWRPSTGAAFLNLDNQYPALDMAYMPGTNYLAIASSDFRLEIRNTKNSGLIQDFVGHTGAVLAVAVSADGAILASGSADGTARIWNVGDGSLISVIEDHLAPVSDLAISPDGKLLATASWDGTIKLWSLPEGSPLATLIKHTKPVTSIAFSNDSQYLLTGGEDNTLYLWRMQDHALVWRSTQLNGAVLDLAFAHSGNAFASAISDGHVILWHFNAPNEP